jgi:hypothetical protein
MQIARIFLPLCSPAKTHARVSFDPQALADEADRWTLRTIVMIGRKRRKVQNLIL